MYTSAYDMRNQHSIAKWMGIGLRVMNYDFKNAPGEGVAKVRRVFHCEIHEKKVHKLPIPCYTVQMISK